MSNRETYSEIRETLAALGAPPGDTIAERIEGLLRERTAAAARIVVTEREKLDAAMAALNAANLYVAEGTLATGIEGLARRRDDAAESARLATERADRMDAQWAAAERRAVALEEQRDDARACAEEADKRTAAAEGRYADEEQRHARTRTRFAAEVERTEELAKVIADLRAETQRQQAQLDWAARIEHTLLRHDGAGRHYCPACVVRRGASIAEVPCPHPEHR